MTIRDMQKEIHETQAAKGGSAADIPREFCLLYGEVARAHEAWRKNQENAGEDLAEAAIRLMKIARMLNVDLEEEIENKMAFNRSRSYTGEKGASGHASSR